MINYIKYNGKTESYSFASLHPDNYADLTVAEKVEYLEQKDEWIHSDCESDKIRQLYHDAKCRWQAKYDMDEIATGEVTEQTEKKIRQFWTDDSLLPYFFDALFDKVRTEKFWKNTLQYKGLVDASMDK